MTLEMVRDAIVAEILDHDLDEEVHPKAFTDAVIDRLRRETT